MQAGKRVIIGNTTPRFAYLLAKQSDIPVERNAEMYISREIEGIGDYETGFGHVICQAKEPYLVSKDVQAIPVWAI